MENHSWHTCHINLCFPKPQTFSYNQRIYLGLAGRKNFKELNRGSLCFYISSNSQNGFLDQYEADFHGISNSSGKHSLNKTSKQIFNH